MASAKKNFVSPTNAFISIPNNEPVEHAADPEGFTVPAGYKLVRESKSARLQLLVTPTISAELKSAAAAQGTSVNELCNRIFEEYLKGAK